MKRDRLPFISRIRQAHIARHERFNAAHEAFYLDAVRDRRRISKYRVPFPLINFKWFILGSIALFVIIFAIYAAAHGIVALLDDSWLAASGNTFVRMLLTAAAMMLILVLAIVAIRLIFDPGRKQIMLLLDWIEAMRRMSRGDFNVTLDAGPGHPGQVGVLVNMFNKMATSLNRMEQMRQEFISNVSHEFQSPLTSIGGFAKALRDDDLPPDTRRHYLHIIESECARLSKLSDSLLKLTSLEANKHPFELRSYRLDHQLRRIVLSCEPQWRAKQLELDVELDETTITADEHLLDQAWSNLVHNAVKFTPSGGQIHVSLQQRDQHIAVTVADSGIGVSPEDVPRLFERFFKADKSRNRAAGGSGLGLSITRKIVDMHGGTISVDSTPGQGTTFRVELPAVSDPGIS